jgi:hypothetical protein
MRVFQKIFGSVVALVATGAVGFWLGQHQQAAPTTTSNVSEPLTCVRYEVQRAQPDRSDPYPWVHDDTDDRVRSFRPAQRVCLQFSKPLLVAAPEHFQSFLKIAGVDNPTMTSLPGGLCIGGWAKETTKLDITISAGLPAADGSKTSGETKVAIELWLYPSSVLSSLNV